MFNSGESPLPFIIFVAIALALVALSRLRNNKIRQDGIEAEAIVSRIDESDSADSDEAITTSYTYYVRYKNQNGEEQEAVLVNPKKGLAQGSRIGIKYVPEKPGVAVMSE